MDRRQTLKLMGGAAALAGAGFPGLAFAQAQKEMVTVVKIAGIPWFNALEKGIQKGAKDFGINCRFNRGCSAACLMSADTTVWVSLATFASIT